jgi:hypothetical protein
MPDLVCVSGRTLLHGTAMCRSGSESTSFRSHPVFLVLASGPYNTAPVGAVTSYGASPARFTPTPSHRVVSLTARHVGAAPKHAPSEVRWCTFSSTANSGRKDNLFGFSVRPKILFSESVVVTAHGRLDSHGTRSGLRKISTQRVVGRRWVRYKQNILSSSLDVERVLEADWQTTKSP